MTKKKYSFVIKSDNENPDFGWRRPENSIALNRFEEPKVFSAYGLNNQNYNPSRPVQPTQSQIDSVMTDRDNADRGINQPQNQNDALLRNISQLSKEKRFTSPQINQPKMGTALDVINATTKDRPLIWDDPRLKKGLEYDKNVYPMPREREIDPVTKTLLGLLLTPPQTAIQTVEGIPEQIGKLGELRKRGDYIGGTLQTGADLIKDALGMATPFNPVLSGFAVGGKAAEDVGAGDAANLLMSPLQTLIKPESATGKSLAELGDLAYNIALFKKIGDLKTAHTIKGMLSEGKGIEEISKSLNIPIEKVNNISTILDKIKGATNEKAEARQRTKGNGANDEQGNVGQASQETGNTSAKLQEKVGGENAVQEQITNPQVLRGEQPRVGLPKVDEGNVQPEKIAGESKAQEKINLAIRSKKIIEKGVEKLGSIEEVNKKWSGNKPSDIYARQYAQKIFNKELPKQEIIPDAEQQASDLPTLTDQNKNAAFDLFNKGKTLDDISTVLKIPKEKALEYKKEFDVQKTGESQNIEQSGSSGQLNQSQGKTSESALNPIQPVENNLPQTRDTAFVEAIQYAKKQSGSDSLLSLAWDRNLVPKDKINQFGEDVLKLKSKGDQFHADVSELIQKYNKGGASKTGAWSEPQPTSTLETRKEKLIEAINQANWEKIQKYGGIDKYIEDRTIRIEKEKKQLEPSSDYIQSLQRDIDRAKYLQSNQESKPEPIVEKPQVEQKPAEQPKTDKGQLDLLQSTPQEKEAFDDAFTNYHPAQLSQMSAEEIYKAIPAADEKIAQKIKDEAIKRVQTTQPKATAEQLSQEIADLKKEKEMFGKGDANLGLPDNTASYDRIIKAKEDELKNLNQEQQPYEKKSNLSTTEEVIQSSRNRVQQQIDKRTERYYVIDELINKGDIKYKTKNVRVGDEIVPGKKIKGVDYDLTYAYDGKTYTIKDLSSTNEIFYKEKRIKSEDINNAIYKDIESRIPKEIPDLQKQTERPQAEKPKRLTDEEFVDVVNTMNVPRAEEFASKLTSKERDKLENLYQQDKVEYNNLSKDELDAYLWQLRDKYENEQKPIEQPKTDKGQLDLLQSTPQAEAPLVKETPEGLTKGINEGAKKENVLQIPKGANAVIVKFKNGRQSKLPIKDLDVLGNDYSSIKEFSFGKAGLNKNGGIRWDTFSPLIKQPKSLGYIGDSEIPKGMEPKGEPIKASSIIKQLSDDLNVPIRVGKERWGKRVGVFKIKPEVIRTKEANDLAVTSHEVAHFIDKKFLGESLRKWKNELASLDYDKTKKRTNEGFAEFMRHYLTMDDAKEIAPKFYKYFTDEFLPKNIELAKTISKAKESITKWREQGALSRVLSQVDSTGKPQPSSAKEKITETKLKLQSAVTDRLAPLKYVVDQILKESGGEKLRPSEDTYQIARSVEKTSSAKAREFVMNGAFDFGLNKIGKSLKEIVEPISQDIENAIAYAYAKHAESLHKREINPGISLDDAQYVLKNHYKPEYEQFSKDFTEWSNYVLDYLIDAGGLSKEAATRMREVNPFYIPLKRAFETESFTAPRGKGFTDLPSPIKRIKGSGREIINPLESMIAQTEQIIAVADKSRVARSLADLADKFEGAGKWIEKIPAPMEAKMVELESMKKQIENLGGDLSNADLDAMVTLFSQGKGYFGKDNIVSIYRDGKREYFQLHPYLYDAMKGLDKVTLPWFLDYTFGKATRLVRLGATGIRAGFSLITNPIRDAQTFALQSEHAGVRPDKIAKAILEEFRGKSEYAREFRRAGGEMAQPLGLDRKMLQNTINEILANDVKRKAMNIVEHPVEALRRVLSFPEAGTRLAEFEAVMNKYKPKFEEAKANGDLVELKKLQEDAAIEASNAASEVTVNFKRAGSYSAVLNQIIPFFNPAIQGVSRMGRTIWDHPVRSGLRATALMTAPTLALWAINKDEDWYKNLPSWERYAFWHFKVGDTIVRLPKPFEWGYVFAGIPEGIANSIYQENPEYVQEAITEAVKNLSPDFVPALIKPAAEAYFNWDMFRERPIVSRSQEGLLPEQQFTPYTSGVAKEAGQILGVSPSKIDHLLSGYTGGLATDILNALPKEIKEPADIPIAGRLFTREGAVGFNGENIKDFYTAYSRAESLYKTINKAYDAGKELKITDEDEKYLEQREQLVQIARQLSLLRKQEQQINQMNVDSDIKKKMIQSIEAAAVKLAEQGIMFLKSPKEQERIRRRGGQ